MQTQGTAMVRWSIWGIAVAVLIAGAAIAVATYLGLDRIAGAVALIEPPRETVATAAPPPVPAEPAVSIADVSFEGSPFIGKADAPVAIAYWFDYQCPFCKQLEFSVMPDLLKEYVDTGIVRLYYKDFEFLGEDSFAAAVIARAVWDVAPDRFAQWHRAVFDKQDAENRGWGSTEDVLALTETIEGIDVAKVRALAASNADEYRARIDRDFEEGNRLGINGTPGTIIGTQLISGAAQYGKFKAAIEKARMQP